MTVSEPILQRDRKRRRFLALVSFWVALSMIMVACGQTSSESTGPSAESSSASAESSPASSEASPATSGIPKGGILTFAVQAAQASESLDPARTSGPSQYMLDAAVWDTLTYVKPDTWEI